MQLSLPIEPADQNIKAVDPAGFAEIAKIVAESKTEGQLREGACGLSEAGRGAREYRAHSETGFAAISFG
jgi:hypothetical protein